MSDAMAMLAAQIAALRKNFLTRLPSAMREIEDRWEQCARDGFQEAGCRELVRLVHSLAGSGGTFGVAAVSDAARSLEVLLGEMLEMPLPPRAAGQAEVAQSLRALRAVVDTVAES